MAGASFTCVSGVAAAMPEDNIDTDIIFPARFLLLTARQGLGAYMFHDRRFAADGTPRPEHVLNDDRFRTAPILVAGANFGSGSSREQAVWALHDHGVRVLIASSFGEIFFANSLRNGIVPIRLTPDIVAMLIVAAQAQRRFTVDLVSQTLRVDGMQPIPFSIPPDKRQALLNGWDETDQIVHHHGPAIATFEQGQRARQPWLHQEDQTA